MRSPVSAPTASARRRQLVVVLRLVRSVAGSARCALFFPALSLPFSCPPVELFVCSFVGARPARWRRRAAGARGRESFESLFPRRSHPPYARYTVVDSLSDFTARRRAGGCLRPTSRDRRFFFFVARRCRRRSVVARPPAARCPPPFPTGPRLVRGADVLLYAAGDTRRRAARDARDGASAATSSEPLICLPPALAPAPPLTDRRPRHVTLIARAARRRASLTPGPSS